MDNLLDKIIKTDADARQKLKEAEAYRKEQMASLPQRKDEIIKAENKKAIDNALKSSRSSQNTAQKKLQEIEERNKKATLKMEQQYDENHIQWEEKMLKSIIG